MDRINALRPATRRRFLVVTGLGGAASLLAACQPAPVAAPSAPNPAPTPAPPAAATGAPVSAPKPAALNLPKPERASFSYGMNAPNYVTQLAHFVALEKGYFQEVGFDTIEVVTGDEYMAGAVGGTLLLAQGDTDVVMAASAKGEKMPWLGAYRDHEYRIIGLAKGISSVQDLKGKQVSGGPSGSRNENNMKRSLAKLGLDPNDVEWVAIRGGSEGRIQALIAGKVAAASVFPRHEQPLVAAGGRFLTRERVAMPQEGYFAKAETLQQYPNLVVAYLAATLKAKQWLKKDKETIASHKAEAIDIITKHGFKVPEEYRSQYDDIEMGQLSTDDGFAPASMDQLVEESQAVNALPTGFEWRKAVDLGPLHKAQAAVGRPPNPVL